MHPAVPLDVAPSKPEYSPTSAGDECPDGRRRQVPAAEPGTKKEAQPQAMNVIPLAPGTKKAKKDADFSADDDDDTWGAWGRGKIKEEPVMPTTKNRIIVIDETKFDDVDDEAQPDIDNVKARSTSMASSASHKLNVAPTGSSTAPAVKPPSPSASSADLRLGGSVAAELVENQDTIMAATMHLQNVVARQQMQCSSTETVLRAVKQETMAARAAEVVRSVPPRLSAERKDAMRAHAREYLVKRKSQADAAAAAFENEGRWCMAQLELRRQSEMAMQSTLVRPLQATTAAPTACKSAAPAPPPGIPASGTPAPTAPAAPAAPPPGIPPPPAAPPPATVSPAPSAPSPVQATAATIMPPPPAKAPAPSGGLAYLE